MSIRKTPGRARVLPDAVCAVWDTLEARQMLANDPLTVGTFSNGGIWLNVVGTANDDEIVVRQNVKGTYTVTNGTWTLTRKGTFVGVRVTGGAGNDSVSIGGTFAARAWLLGDAGNDTLTGGTLNDVLSGGAGDDSLDGGVGNDALNGEAGNDVLRGGAGNDGLNGGLDNDTLDGGLGNDAMNGSAGDDSLNGGDGNDNLIGDLGNDTLEGNAGNDVMTGGAGDDSLDGGVGNDTLNGQSGNDALLGDAGNDSLLGDVGNDTLLGGAGNDTLNGGVGDDSVDGGADADRLIGDLGSDVYVGGSGLDFFDYTGRTVALTIALDGEANDGAAGENDNVGDDLETIVGGNAADTLTGDENANILYGGLGNDTINGGGGADRLYGGAGLDVLNGGAGNDSLYGQADADKLFGDDDNDLLEGGAGNDSLDGGAGRDQIIAIGGGVLDRLTGGEDLDSYWLDSDASETILDVAGEETAARAVHRVKAFVSYGRTAVSKELSSQKLADPVGSGKLVNFAQNKLFASNGPSPDDIAQGQAGDCWYLAGLSAIAKTMPEVLRQSITSLGDGTYAVRFMRGSAEQYVRIDADLYTYSWSASTQSYARTGAEGSIWAPMLEKALTWVRGSKLGNYATINSGWMTETNSFLGLTSTNLWRGGVSSAGGMIDWLKTQLDAGKAVTFGTGGVQAGSGLVGSHAYLVSSVADNGDGTYRVIVRNPWGTDGYGSTDGANDGYLTLSAATLFANYSGLTAAA